MAIVAVRALDNCYKVGDPCPGSKIIPHCTGTLRFGQAEGKLWVECSSVPWGHCRRATKEEEEMYK